MVEDSIEIIESSGNVFRDLGLPNPDMRLAKTQLGAEISKILDEEGLSFQQAKTRSGIIYSEFRSIRRATYSCFTLDRLMIILSKLDRNVEISIDVQRRSRSVHHP